MLLLCSRDAKSGREKESNSRSPTNAEREKAKHASRKLHFKFAQQRGELALKLTEILGTEEQISFLLLIRFAFVTKPATDLHQEKERATKEKTPEPTIEVRSI